MQTVPPPIVEYLQQKTGTEPICIVEIQWFEGGTFIAYSDQKINGATYPYPLLLEMGAFDVSMQVTGSSDSQEVSITLDDTNGDLKALLDSVNIHKQPCRIYHAYKGLDLAYKILLFEGKINSPIVWDEGARTVEFSILSEQLSVDVAFSMEEGNFPNVPKDALGKVWPLIFGQVCNVETVQVRSPRMGYLVHGEGWHDFTLPDRICQATRLQCAPIAGPVVEHHEPGPGEFFIITTQQAIPDPACVERRYKIKCDNIWLYAQQLEYENAVINIQGGDDFPQSEYITLNVNGGLLRGSFNGTYFTVQSREHPEYETLDAHNCIAVGARAYSVARTRIHGGWEDTSETGNGTTWHVPQDDPMAVALDECNAAYSSQMIPVEGAEASWEIYNAMPSADFFWASAGSEVFLEAEKEILHIVSLIPGVVDDVVAYRTTLSGRKLLVSVPTNYYTVYETDYVGYNVIEIGLEKKLSQIDSSWDDTLYVSFTSSIGPNPVDIIEWLINKYTTLAIDATSFTAVKGKLTNYPCNFAMKTEKNVLELIQDIARQSRCAMYIRNGVLYLIYLSEEPASVRTITENDIVAQTFQVQLTETEDLVTKSIIDWRETDAGINSEKKVDNKIILRYNIPRYGVQEENETYYTQNIYGTILKSATFWLIRQSNSWKYVEFDCPLAMIDLDVFDCIELNVAEFSAAPIKCIITQIKYDADKSNLHLKCWTPVLAGESSPYFWAWPANQPAASVYPLSKDIDKAGGGYLFEITPPTNHILASGYTDESLVMLTNGDTHPSDLDDIFPSIICVSADTYDESIAFEDYEAPEFDAFAARQGDLANTPNSNQETDWKVNPPREACGEPTFLGGCLYEVNVTYARCSLRGGCCDEDGVCNCDSGPCGCGVNCKHDKGSCCAGDITTWCHVFGSLRGAESFKAAKISEAIAINACEWTCGKTGVIGVSSITTIQDPLLHDECPTSTSPSLDAEAFQPHKV